MSYDANNLFARILKGEIPAHKVYENEHVFAFMDIMPQAKGHVLLIPKTPAVELTDLPPEEAVHLFAAAQKIIAAQRRVLGVNGIIQMQLNHADAGQSIFHYHIHLIPTHIHQLGTHASEKADDAQLAQLASALAADIAAQ